MKRAVISALSLLLTLSFLATGCNTTDSTDSSVKISTQQVKQGNLQIGVYADGRIEIPLTKVNFSVKGTIATVVVQPGQMVSAGDLLAELDSSDMLAAITNAENNLRKAEVAYSDSLTSRDYTLKSEKIKLDSLYAKYLAPFDDTIYAQTINDAENKLREKQIALADVQVALDELLAEQIRLAELAEEMASLTTETPPATTTTTATVPSESTPATTTTIPAATSGSTTSLVTDASTTTSTDIPPTTETTIAPTTTPAPSTTAKLTSSPSPSPQPSLKPDDTLTSAIAAAQKDVAAAQTAVDAAQSSLTNALNSRLTAKARYDSEKTAAREAYNLQKLRYENLSVSTAAIVNAELNKTEAENRLLEARAALYHTKLYAPAAGKIIEVAYGPGETVQEKTASASGAPDFITLYDPTNVQLTAKVNEGDVSSLAAGQDMRVSIDALFLENQPGTITEVSILPQIDNTGIVTYAVTGQLEAPDERILDGMSVFVLFLQREKLDVLLAPNKAVFMEDGLQHVHVLNADGTTSKRAVLLGLTNGIVSEVIEGLTAGESVVTSGIES